MQEENDQDTIEFSKPGGLSFREIVMNQFARCVQLCNVEFRGGFYTKVPLKDGQEKLIYIQDTREMFSNAVYGLAMIMQPKFDESMRQAWTKCRGLLKNIQKEFIIASSPEEEVILGDNFYIEKKDKILLETYKNKKLEIFMALFTKLSNQLSRKNYMEITGGVF